MRFSLVTLRCALAAVGYRHARSWKQAVHLVHSALILRGFSLQQSCLHEIDILISTFISLNYRCLCGRPGVSMLILLPPSADRWLTLARTDAKTTNETITTYSGNASTSDPSLTTRRIRRVTFPPTGPDEFTVQFCIAHVSVDPPTIVSSPTISRFALSDFRSTFTFAYDLTDFPTSHLLRLGLIPLHPPLPSHLALVTDLHLFGSGRGLFSPMPRYLFPSHTYRTYY